MEYRQKQYIQPDEQRCVEKALGGEQRRVALCPDEVGAEGVIAGGDDKGRQYGSGIDTIAGNIIERFQENGSLADIANANIFGGLGTITSPFLVLFIIIMMGYAVIKVFFSNLKRRSYSWDHRHSSSADDAPAEWRCGACPQAA